MHKSMHLHSASRACIFACPCHALAHRQLVASAQTYDTMRRGQVPPFEAANQLALAVKIKAGRVARIPEGYSDDLNNAIRSMLQLESGKRPR